jgi:IstB-like ATP binding protein
VSTTPPPLPVDLEAGLRRLRLGAMRQQSPVLLVVAKTQRWKPEEFLRTLVEAEIASRDASNARSRLKAAAFPVSKTLDEFDVDTSSVPRARFDDLASLEWIAAKENLCLVGLAGTGKSHLLVALGHHAIEAGRRVRYFTATELVETLYRRLADNSVGRMIEQILKADLAIRRLGTVPARAHHDRRPARPAPPSPRRRGHLRRVVPAQGGPPKGRRPEAHPRVEHHLEGCGHLVAKTADWKLATDNPPDHDLS